MPDVPNLTKEMRVLRLGNRIQRSRHTKLLEEREVSRLEKVPRSRDEVVGDVPARALQEAP